MIKFVPGLIAAIAAFIILKLFGWVGSLSTQILLFFGTYGVVVFVVDAAMKRYGETKRED
jgi:ABC-type maltose transport system permease subunit